MEWLNNSSMAIMNKSLDGLWARQKTISDNIANYETPNYKRKYVTFEQELKNQIEKNKSFGKKLVADIKGTTSSVHQDNTLTLRADGNNVDIEYENTEMARAQFNYMYLTRELNDHFSRLRHAISEGKK